MALLPSLILLILIPATQSSDVRLEGARLALFERTKGASELGRDVHWRIPAAAFSRPTRQRRGYDLYVHKGVGLVIGSRAADLQEIRRRGGVASVRGRVFRVPPKRRGRGEPAYAIDVRQIRRRRN